MLDAQFIHPIEYSLTDKLADRNEEFLFWKKVYEYHKQTGESERDGETDRMRSRNIVIDKDMLLKK